jgi:thiamine biosynthesis lipoprotein
MRRNRPMLGTFVELWIEEDLHINPEQMAFNQEIGNVVYQQMEKVQALMSSHDKSSEIAQLNRLSKTVPGIVFTLHPWTYEVFMIAQRVFAETGGVFDCGVGQYSPSYPSKSDQLQDSGIGSIDLLENYQIRLNQRLQIDLGGIAKGYAVDRGIEVLKNFEIKNALINAGGDLRIIGGIEQSIYLKESLYRDAYIYMGKLKDGAVATSSTRFGRDNKKGGMSYLINPKTGECIEDDLSYSIVAPTCVVADCLTKALAIEKNIHAPYFETFGAIPIIVE